MTPLRMHIDREHIRLIRAHVNRGTARPGRGCGDGKRTGLGPASRAPGAERAPERSLAPRAAPHDVSGANKSAPRRAAPRGRRNRPFHGENAHATPFPPAPHRGGVGAPGAGPSRHGAAAGRGRRLPDASRAHPADPERAALARRERVARPQGAGAAPAREPPRHRRAGGAGAAAGRLPHLAAHQRPVGRAHVLDHGDHLPRPRQRGAAPGAAAGRHAHRLHAVVAGRRAPGIRGRGPGRDGAVGGRRGHGDGAAHPPRHAERRHRRPLPVAAGRLGVHRAAGAGRARRGSAGAPRAHGPAGAGEPGSHVAGAHLPGPAADPARRAPLRLLLHLTAGAGAGGRGLAHAPGRAGDHPRGQRIAGRALRAGVAHHEAIQLRGARGPLPHAHPGAGHDRPRGEARRRHPADRRPPHRLRRRRHRRASGGMALRRAGHPLLGRGAGPGRPAQAVRRP